VHPPDDGVLPQNESSKTTGEFAACAVHFFAWLLKSRRDRWKAIVLTAQAVQKRTLLANGLSSKSGKS